MSPEEEHREIKALNCSSLRELLCSIRCPIYNVEMSTPCFGVKLNVYLLYLCSRTTDTMVLVDTGINFILILNSEESKMNAYFIKGRPYFIFKYL